MKEDRKKIIRKIVWLTRGEKIRGFECVYDSGCVINKKIRLVF